MKSSWSTPSVVVDASLVIRLLVSTADSEEVQALFASWYRAGTQLVAPDFMVAEVVSGIRRLAFAGKVPAADVAPAVEDLFQLDLDLVPLDPGLCARALDWAERLRQSKAYDSLYLALAERESAPFFTADGRLARAMKQLGIDWVELAVGEL